ncbi:MAG TPA: hypothetical protein VK961_20080, partial [Chthoniobacter sp.]|nr:hypothetical protein [Chthoniobacter sp.]
MKADQNPGPIERILAVNPQIEGLRIDAEERDLEVGFAEEVPPAPVLAKIDKSLSHDLPNPELVVHSPEVFHTPGVEGAKVHFHHHHLGKGAIEFHRGEAEPLGTIVWRKFKVPRWQNRLLPEAESDYRLMLLLSGVCGAAGLAGYFAAQAPATAWLVLPAFLISYVSGGWYAAREVAGELRRGKIDVHFLMLIVALGALLVNARAEGATLLFLFSLSGGLEQFAHYRTRKTISSLLKVAPKQVLRRSAGTWVETAIENVQPEDELLIKPGELFPVDGVVLEGATSADESALTGESLSVTKRVGDAVSGGTLNLEGQAVVRVKRLPRDSAVQRVVALIESAQKQKAPAQRFTDTFSRYYTWAVLALSAILFLVLLA